MIGKNFSKHRIIISQICGIFLTLFIIFSQPVLQYTVWYAIMLIFGILLVFICILGRIFSSLFMSDNRNRSVVRFGIYSTTRNPLYFFSFLGVVGVGLIYSSILVLVVLILFYWFYYYQVITDEERYLSEKFGTEYTDYLKSGVPRFFPKRKLWKAEDYVRVNYKVTLKTIKESSLFLLIAFLVLVILLLQNMGLIHTFIYII